MSYGEVRQKVLTVVQKAVACGLVRLSAGNFSMRTADGHIAITPSAIKYDVLTADQIAIVDVNGKHIDGPNKSSSETPMHTAIFRNLPEVGAICHTHSPYAMTFAVVGQEIPMVNLELLVCGAPIPVAEWASPGSAKGGEVTVDTFRRRPELKVMLLRNHGLVAIGKTLDEAFEYAYDAEVAAQVYYQALQIGKPIVLTAAQVQEVREIYGMK
ncbi:MAG: class II aldolase/adducin family protein [Caldilineaceae bacterium]